MIIWIIAGLLGLATGVRIGWALVNKQSLVSTAMIVALGSLAVAAALNWQPLTLLLDTVLHWPNISIALSQCALIASAAGSCVMITTVGSERSPVAVRRIALLQYAVAVVIVVVTMALFLAGGRQPEMSTQEYLERNLNTSAISFSWLIPLLYVLLALSMVSWVGLRHSNRSRRGRALFVFTVGTVLILLASAFFMIRAIGSPRLLSVGTAATLLVCAMAIVAAGALLPTIEDWFAARQEDRLIEPILQELLSRQPDIGIGVRPRGPLVFRIAEKLSLISDALFLEASADGRKNWLLDLAQQDENARIRIGRIALDRALLGYDDVARKTRLRATLSTGADGAGYSATSDLRFTAVGQYKGLAVKAQGSGGPVLALRDTTRPYPLKFEASAGRTQVKADGTLTGLLALDAIDMRMTLRGDNLEQLYPLLGIAFPATRPYLTEGHLLHSGSTWRYEQFTGRIGTSDIAGFVQVVTGGKRPALTATGPPLRPVIEMRCGLTHKRPPAGGEGGSIIQIGRAHV